MRSELRVLLLSPDFPPAHGGIQVVAHRLARHLHARVRTVTLETPGAAEFDRAAGLDTRRVRIRRGARRLAVAALNVRAVATALRFRPDVILSAHIVMAPAARLLQRALGIPFVLYVHADEVRGRPGLAAFGVRHADAVIAVSRHASELAIAAGAPAERVHVIPNGVDLPDAVKREPAERKTILTVARLRDRYKGHDVLVRALPLILARVPDAQWVVIGDGPLREQAERLADAHRLDGQVRFLGEVSDEERDAWLGRAHVFAMPSRLPVGGVGGEGFGLVYLEASARGLPVLAGNVGGAVDAVVDGETGVLVDPSDYIAVADALTDLLNNPERAEALGRAGAARAREFAWPVIVAKVETLLREVAAGS